MCSRIPRDVGRRTDGSRTPAVSADTGKLRHVSQLLVDQRIELATPRAVLQVERGIAGERSGDTVASREEERRLLEVPAEVDLGTGDLVLVVKGENLGIPSPSTAGGVGLIGNDHLVARLDQPDELEVLAAAGAGPATLEVAVTVELWVRWRREEKVIAQALLEEAPVAGCKRGI